MLQVPSFFSNKIEKPDYSNFDKSQWTSRTVIDHCTRIAQKKIEKDFGVRYTWIAILWSNFDGPYAQPVTRYRQAYHKNMEI